MAARPLLLLALFAAVSISVCLAERHDVIVGTRIPGDRLIQREHVEKEASVIGKKETITRTFSGDTVSTISQIRALDQHDNDHGATTTFIAGGVGFNYVTIKFESERFRGIDFGVELYGR